MSIRRKILKMGHFEKQEKKYSELCCVPLCSASSKFNDILSFNGFLTHPGLRGQRLVNMRWDHFTICSHTEVCVRRFATDHLIEPTTLDGQRRLVEGAAVRQSLNGTAHWSSPSWGATTDVTRNHDYCSVPEPSALDLQLDLVQLNYKESCHQSKL